MAASDSLIYTVPVSQTAKIGRAVFCNTDTAAHALTINITTGTSSAANQVINPQACILAPGQTYVSPELAGAVLPAGTTLRGFSNANVTMTISGIVITGQ